MAEDLDKHPLRYASARYLIESILLKRIANENFIGCTLETSLEIMDALNKRGLVECD